MYLAKGDVHHIFPRDYLKKQGLSRGKYNQIANYVIMQSEINIRIGNKPPRDYFGELEKQLKEGSLLYGGISDPLELEKNLRLNCIPSEIKVMDINNYEEFLLQRRKLMALKIRDYYSAL